MIKTAFSGMLLSMFLLLGCDNSTGSQASGPVGTWTGTASGITITLVTKGDATFSIKQPESFATYTVIGTYTYTNNAITLNYTAGLLDSLGIPLPSTNPAIGTLAGTKITVPIPYMHNDSTVTLTKK